mgnify:CR=1 FL=1
MRDNFGNTLTKEQEQYFKSSKVKDSQGNLLVCYHGTLAQDRFKEFKPEQGFNISAMYFTDTKGVANHWSKSSYPRLFNKKVVDEKLARMYKLFKDNKYEEYIQLALEILNKDLRQEVNIVPTYKNPKYGYYYRLEDGVSSSPLGYQDKENPFIYFNYDYNHDGDENYKNEYNIDNILDNIIEDYMSQSFYGKGIYYVYLNIENPLIIDAKNSTYYEVEFEGQKTNTESIAVIAKKRGYDGLIVYNVYETDYANKLTNDYIVFKSNQIKSIDNYYPTSSNDITENLQESLLLEKKRQELITQGRKGANYALNNQFRGKNRFERKKYSKVARNVSQFNDIDMNAFFKKDILTIGIRVQGETDYYIVKIKFNGVLKELQRYIKQNNNKFEYKVVLQALTRVFNTGDIYVNCTCPDFKYRFDFWSTVNNYNSGNPQNIPAKITNPNNTKGSGCKHVLLVLANVEWLLRVASVINNYVNYAETHLQKIYADYIFPQIYGVKYSKEVQLQLTDTDDVTSDKELIDIANRLGRNRGRFSSTYQPDRAKGRNAFKKQIGATVEPKGNIKGNSSQKEESGSNDLKRGKNNTATFTKRNNKKEDSIEPIDEK